MDQSTPVAKDRYLMEPMILAGLLQSAASGPSDIIPDIACGTGNAVAMLARLAENVVGLESDEALVAQGNQVLTDLGVDNAVVVLRDLHEGYSKQGPYNLIIIERAVSKFPEAITDQLVDGGRLVAVMTDESGLGRETVVQKVGQLFSNRILFEANLKALPEFSSVPVFVF